MNIPKQPTNPKMPDIKDRFYGEKHEETISKKNTFVEEENDCQFCRELNEEKREIVIKNIYIYGGGGYFKWSCPIKYCPYCGIILKKYKKN